MRDRGGVDTGEVIAALGLVGEPTTGQVRAARRLVARRWHPDLQGDALTTAMAELNAACDRLIRSIRAGQRVADRSSSPVAPPDGGSASAHRTVGDVTRTVVAMLVALVATLVVAGGVTATTLAAAALSAAIVGGGYMLVVEGLDRRRRWRGRPPHR